MNEKISNEELLQELGILKQECDALFKKERELYLAHRYSFEETRNDEELRKIIDLRYKNERAKNIYLKK